VPSIFVGNLSYQTTQADLEAAFGRYGAVERVNIVTDRDTGQPRGFAFVEMTERRNAETAIAHLNVVEMHGNALNVNEARPKPAGARVQGADAMVPVAAVAAAVHAGRSRHVLSVRFEVMYGWPRTANIQKEAKGATT
jgi:RNA recognition motif-containing protein